MTVKSFRVDKLSDFLALSEQVSSPKFVDSKNGLAFFYARKRIEYEVQEREDIDKLLGRGFISGTEQESFESW